MLSMMKALVVMKVKMEKIEIKINNNIEVEILEKFKEEVNNEVFQEEIKEVDNSEVIKEGKVVVGIKIIIIKDMTISNK